MKLSVLAEVLGGELEGPDGETEVSGISTLQNAGHDQICYYGNRAYQKYLTSTKALAVISGERVETSSRNLIIVESPYLAFRNALLIFPGETPSGFTGIHPSSVVHPGAEVGEGVTLGPFSSVDECARIGGGSRIGAGTCIGPGARIGEDCLLYPGVSIYHDCVIGNRVIIHSGAVIGSDGFGFVPDPEGHLKVPQTGIVVIEDDVEIGSGSTIDRAVVGSTVIGRFSKLDNLVHVAHNVLIGPGCLIAAQTGIAGSTIVGTGVTFGGQAGINGHIHIGDRAVIAAQAGVMKDVPAGATVSGYPARSHGTSLRVHAALIDLPEFRRKVMDFMREHSIKEEEGK
ncbi:MAG: UDP-3-O-(3-hydroxymyristoyl)glucosamine N-acyltransferase [Candidatus Fermentibacteraceae bacterium]|nr:UDP-3-O-(3-hydroxymyristoyl)glucosamine N-acyltransferase [Candidatus Fermentibacteraceae bacterium]MBN2609040.1 UDP-3-O-(3-hydroxymyristoyl)glucosamine N-acyltransferase [Candidatus Fermentibacteraceae bacterium]